MNSSNLVIEDSFDRREQELREDWEINREIESSMQHLKASPNVIRNDISVDNIDSNVGRIRLPMSGDNEAIYEENQ